MTKAELRNQLYAKRQEIADIMDLLKAEERQASNREQVSLDKLNDEIRDIEAQLAQPEKPVSKIYTRSTLDANSFSLVNFFNKIYEKRTNEFTDLEKEIRKIGENQILKAGQTINGTALPLYFEQRGTLAAGTSGAGAEAVPEEKFDILMPLRDELVFTAAGATMFTDVVGNPSIPALTGVTAAWKGEVTAAADGVQGMTETEFSPKKLNVYIPVSKLLLRQANPSLEAKLKQDLVNAIASKLESTVLGTASSSSTQPAGLFYGASYSNGGVVVTGSTSWEKVVSLETGINASNARGKNMAYVLHPNTLGKFKVTGKNATYGSTFIAENSLVNGYKYFSTTNMPTISSGKGILFANWADLYIMVWGGIDVEVDPYTSMKEGIVNFIATMYVDVKPIRSASFAKGWLS